MIVTHVIGNGFDINQGLPTRYREFYNFYLQQESSSEIIEKLKKSIAEEIENWSDLELAIGRYTATIDSVDDLEVIMSDIQENLAEYIFRIDSQQYGTDIKVVDEIKQDLILPFRHLKPSEVEQFENLKSAVGPVSDVNVLSFNYTSTLEKILQLDKSKIIGTDSSNRVIFRGTNYIHNSIDEKESIVLGVDNPSQIDNAIFKENDIANLFLVKPQVIKNAGNLNDRKAVQMITSANVISLFGVSLGETDATWWQTIGRSINSNPHKRLIYYYFSPLKISNINKQLVEELKLKNNIIKLMDIKDPSKVYVKLHDGKSMFRQALTPVPVFK